MKIIDSPMFGDVILLDEEDSDFRHLKEMVRRYPANAFGIINKLINDRGFFCVIGTIDEIMKNLGK